MRLLTEFEIQYLSPIHDGYPAWPGGERWLQLYEVSENLQVILTRGLSNGEDYLYEVYLETDDEIAVADFASSWQANLIYETGRIIPNVSNFAQRLEKNSYLTLQFDIDGAPEEWSLENKDGNIGLFIGLKNLDFHSLITPATPLNIKLMRAAELIYSIQNDQSGRIELASLYMQQGNATISNLERESVL